MRRAQLSSLLEFYLDGLLVSGSGLVWDIVLFSTMIGDSDIIISSTLLDLREQFGWWLGSQSFSDFLFLLHVEEDQWITRKRVALGWRNFFISDNFI